MHFLLLIWYSLSLLRERVRERVVKRRSKRGIVPYDVRLVARSRGNRKNPTEAEKRMWELLRRNFIGYKFLRQKPISMFILDFYCSKLMLGIELDGSSHDNKREYDMERSELLNSYGIKIIRYKNDEILKNNDEMADNLLKEIRKRRQELKA